MSGIRTTAWNFVRILYKSRCRPCSSNNSCSKSRSWSNSDRLRRGLTHLVGWDLILTSNSPQVTENSRSKRKQRRSQSNQLVSKIHWIPKKLNSFSYSSISRNNQPNKENPSTNSPLLKDMKKLKNPKSLRVPNTDPIPLPINKRPKLSSNPRQCKPSLPPLVKNVLTLTQIPKNWTWTDSYQWFNKEANHNWPPKTRFWKWAQARHRHQGASPTQLYQKKQRSSKPPKNFYKRGSQPRSKKTHQGKSCN